MKPVLALTLALALALPAGCFGTGPEDLSPVCERKSTTPWYPYAPEQLAMMTDGDSNVTVANETWHALLTAASFRILTQSGAPYTRFHANLAPSDDGASWRFQAVGNTSLADDHYDLVLKANDTAPPAQVDVPETLRLIAWHVANQTAETTEVATRGHYLGAEWSRDLPGCVQIAFSSAPTAQPTTITVGFDLYRVVHVSGPSSTTFA